jgi:hypothetical protein
MAENVLNVKYNQIFTQNLLLFYWTCRHDKQKLFRLVVQSSRGNIENVNNITLTDNKIF